MTAPAAEYDGSGARRPCRGSSNARIGAARHPWHFAGMSDTAVHQDLALAAEFPATDRADWVRLVEKALGWRVSTATSGAAALDAIQTDAPDLVLTDMLMPEMDGLELTQAIRNQYPSIPVVVMTAHGSEEMAIRALRSGAASYVPKRTMARDLAETLEQVATAARASRCQQRLLECLTRVESAFQLENDPALVPPLVLEKPKEGFSIPMKRWLCTSLKPMMLDLLSDSALQPHGYFNHEVVTRWIREHLEGRANHSHRLWSLMVFEMWRHHERVSV